MLPGLGFGKEYDKKGGGRITKRRKRRIPLIPSPYLSYIISPLHLSQSFKGLVHEYESEGFKNKKNDSLKKKGITLLRMREKEEELSEDPRGIWVQSYGRFLDRIHR